MSEESNRIAVEIDERAVRRLLRSRDLSLEEMHSIGPQGRKQLRNLLLDLLRQELDSLPNY